MRDSNCIVLEPRCLVKSVSDTTAFAIESLERLTLLSAFLDYICWVQRATSALRRIPGRKTLIITGNGIPILAKRSPLALVICATDAVILQPNFGSVFRLGST
jgi:hypothetical protein